MAVLAGFLAVLFSGCVSEGETNKQCDGEVCVTTPKPGDVFLTNATRPSLLFDSCWGAGLTTNVPPEWTEGVLPPEFEPSGGIDPTDLSAQLEIRVVECPSFVVDNVTAPAMRIVSTKMDAYPRDNSWQTAEHTEFLFEIYVTDVAVAERMAELHLPAIHADISSDAVDTPIGPQYTWTVKGGGHEYILPFFKMDGGSGAVGGTVYSWTQDVGYWRFDGNGSVASAGQGGLSAGPVHMTGDSSLRRILGADSHAFIIQAYQEYQDEWRIYPRMFGGVTS